MKRLVVLFSGTGTNLEYILSTIHRREIEVVGLITNNPDAGGIDVARRYNLSVDVISQRGFESREKFDEVLVEKILSYSPDLTVLAGFMRIVTTIFTSQIRAINLHPSLLPRHKGLNAIERSFEDEYDDGGVTVHWVEEELDSGEIVLQRSVSKRGLSFEQYYNIIRKMEKEALVEAILAVVEDRTS
jgi:phosphoribosylglycinamide formyltransferase-1